MFKISKRIFSNISKFFSYSFPYIITKPFGFYSTLKCGVCTGFGITGKITDDEYSILKDGDFYEDSKSFLINLVACFENST